VYKHPSHVFITQQLAHIKLSQRQHTAEISYLYGATLTRHEHRCQRCNRIFINCKNLTNNMVLLAHEQSTVSIPNCKSRHQQNRKTQKSARGKVTAGLG